MSRQRARTRTVALRPAGMEAGQTTALWREAHLKCGGEEEPRGDILLRMSGFPGDSKQRNRPNHATPEQFSKGRLGSRPQRDFFQSAKGPTPVSGCTDQSWNVKVPVGVKTTLIFSDWSQSENTLTDFSRTSVATNTITGSCPELFI